MMKILGITGGVGSGKSQTLSYLKAIDGVIVCEADLIGREVQEKDSYCLEAMSCVFGSDILEESGALNRRRLGELVFSDEEKLKQLNAIIHPLVRKKIEELILFHKSQGKQVFVLEAAILLESNYAEICDEIWYIRRDDKLRMKHLQESRHYTKELFESIVSRQLTAEEFEKGCTKTIDNNGSLKQLYKKIDLEFKQLLGEAHEIM